MFAVIKAGGKQYRVAANDVISVAKLNGEPGDAVAFEDVILFNNEGKTEFGAPAVAGVTVAGQVVEQARGPKVIAFKKRRRQNSKRKRGHRQDLTVIRITDILTGGRKPELKAETKAQTQEPQKSSKAAPKGEDDISLIGGLGPTLKKKLNAAGVTSLKDIAGWTETDIARYDAELNLRGRITREEWVEQAKELLAGKPPRAKIDQDRAKGAE